MDNVAAIFIGILAIPFVIALGAVLSLILAWPVMLILGAAASVSGGLVPAIGYWTTFLLVFALRVAVAGSGNTVNKG